jgi:NTE family protein
MWLRIFLFLMLVSTTLLRAQTFENIVFEGAGVRGIAYVGAIKELENRNMLSSISKTGGTSAGAIAALTLALGYNANEIEHIIYDTKVQRFNDGRFFFVGGIARINKKYGWYRGDAFTRWLEKIIKAKTGNADITFRQLHEKNFRDLYVTGTSLNHQKLIVFSYKNYPEMKIKDAVRISMSIPLWFEAVMIDSAGRVVSKRDMHDHFDLMVDGGLTGEFPIFMFDSLAEGSNRIANSKTIGCRIDAPDQIVFDQTQKGLAPFEINRFRNYIGAFYSYVIESMNRSQLTPADWQRSVSISSGNIGPKIRRLSVVEKNMLIKNGQEAMCDFLTRNVTEN